MNKANNLANQPTKQNMKTNLPARQLSDKELNRLSEKTEEALQGLRFASSLYEGTTAIIIFLPILVSGYLILNRDIIYLIGLFLEEVGLPVVPLGIFITLLILSLCVGAIPFMLYRNRLNYARANVDKIDGEIEEIKLSSPKLRLRYLQKQHLVIGSSAGRLNWIDKRRRAKSEELRQKIGDDLGILEKVQINGRLQNMYVPDWDDVQFNLARWGELINDERRELNENRNWKFMSVGIALMYLVLIIAGVPAFDTIEDVFGIPFPIIIWSGLGSFAAILYRFYKSPDRIKFEKELRWLIARPIIGIVMGAVSYLALVSGALVFSATPSADLPASLKDSGQLWQFWIVAFLSGFSDKFYEKVIEWLTSKFTAGTEDGTEEKDTEIEEEEKDADVSKNLEKEKQEESTTA